MNSSHHTLKILWLQTEILKNGFSISEVLKYLHNVS